MYISSTESSSETVDLPLEWNNYFPPSYCSPGSKKEDVRKVKPPKQVAQRNDNAMAKTAKQIAKELLIQAQSPWPSQYLFLSRDRYETI